MNKKKLLLLGGLKYLIPVIEKAKNLGYYVITCDYLPHNIAHKYSDEYHNISILDKDSVLSLAMELNIDGIMSFAVDPGVLTAAYVCDKMGLPTAGPYKSIEILQDKGAFRDFLRDNNFNVPNSKSYKDINLALKEFDFNLPVIVKPVDSAGSKGVTKVNTKAELEVAILNAVKASPTKTFIIEDYLECKGFASDTDCFSVNGSLDFITFSNQRFDLKSPNPYAPAGFTWPSTMSEENQDFLKKELKRLINLLEMKSSIYNIEVRLATNDKPYIMEVSPRGGGNRLSEMIEIATGVDLITHNIKSAMGEKVESLKEPQYKTNLGQLILHSNKGGVFKEVLIDPRIQKNIVEIDLWIKTNDIINSFSSASDSIGTIVLEFSEKEKLEDVINNYSNYINVVVE
ncbi:ATP-grasp domain-containing protein [uncultured Polaribacter sp.]|uniref:ATP-grasp domain-containing protein n=1 Tax=uncultured Polaribacter sp. TaxID=174711 RepID=UPI002615973C|nr:ATP-grasp domain-containing protein [uncultured Polaribacter sp.]